jgi:uncharacterized protein (DUF58 family)
MPGDVRSSVMGSGTELAQIRPYRPGDDVRTIDWNVTARTGEPHVRLHVAERALTTWVVLDASASMVFGSRERTKADVADGVVLALSHGATSGANRLGMIVAGADPSIATPPTGDRRRLLRLLETLHETPPRAGDLADALEVAERVTRRSGAVVVVSDFRGGPGWVSPLSRSARRHHVLAVEIVDPLELALPAACDVVFADPETGAHLRVDTSDPRVRRNYAEASAAERDDVRRAIVGAGARHVTLTTAGDWLRPLAAALSRRRAA